MCLAESGRKV